MILQLINILFVVLDMKGNTMLTPFSFTPMSSDIVSTFIDIHFELYDFLSFFLEDYELD
jgi:hypothetical protein